MYSIHPISIHPISIHCIWWNDWRLFFNDHRLLRNSHLSISMIRIYRRNAIQGILLERLELEFWTIKKIYSIIKFALIGCFQTKKMKSQNFDERVSNRRSHYFLIKLTFLLKVTLYNICYYIILLYSTFK